MISRHLSDDRLIELGLTGNPSAPEQQHLGACPVCESRRAATARVLEEVSIVAHEDADEVFTAERLARQQSRIFQRIDHEGRPARVIAFPAAQEAPSVVSRTRPASRWIAAAAVAGLVVGLAAGRLAPDTRRALGGGRQTTTVVTTAPAQALTAATPLSDDQLLGEIELAINGRGGPSLQPLDELTPRAWEVR